MDWYCWGLFSPKWKKGQTTARPQIPAFAKKRQEEHGYQLWSDVVVDPTWDTEQSTWSMDDYTRAFSKFFPLEVDRDMSLPRKTARGPPEGHHRGDLPGSSDLETQISSLGTGGLHGISRDHGPNQQDRAWDNTTSSLEPRALPEEPPTESKMSSIVDTLLHAAKLKWESSSHISAKERTELVSLADMITQAPQNPTESQAAAGIDILLHAAQLKWKYSSQISVERREELATLADRFAQGLPIDADASARVDWMLKATITAEQLKWKLSGHAPPKS